MKIIPKALENENKIPIDASISIFVFSLNKVINNATINVNEIATKSGSIPSKIPNPIPPKAE
jgi:hypothetical protein